MPGGATSSGYSYFNSSSLNVHRSEVQSPLDRLRVTLKQLVHLLAGLQVPLGVGEQAVAGVVDPCSVADAGQHVLQAAGGRGRGSGRGWSPRAAAGTFTRRAAARAGEAPGVVAGVAVGQDEIKVLPALTQPTGQSRERGVRLIGRQQSEDLPIVMAEDVVERQRAAARGCQPLAVGQERAEPAYARLSSLLTHGKRLAAKGGCTLTLDDVLAHDDGQVFALLPPDDAGRRVRRLWPVGCVSAGNAFISPDPTATPATTPGAARPPRRTRA